MDIGRRVKARSVRRLRLLGIIEGYMHVCILKVQGFKYLNEGSFNYQMDYVRRKKMFTKLFAR